jgi:hypothetical protein
MVAMNARKRRRICRTAFLLGCLLPTTAHIFWTVWLRSPWHANRQAAWIEQRIAAKVSMEGVRHPRPGTLACRTLRIADPETGRPLLALHGVECSGGGNRTWTLSVLRVELAASAMAPIWHRCAHVLKSSGEGSLRLAARDVALVDKKATRRLGHLRGRFQTGRSQSLMEMGVWIPSDEHVGGSADEGAVRFRAIRDRTATPPITQWELDARSVPISCGLLSECLPEASRPGHDCSFRGYVWSRRQSDQWTAELVGELKSLDLGKLLHDTLDGPLAGRAHVVLERGVIRNGRVEQLRGRLTAGPGEIGLALCQSAAENLKLTSTAGFSQGLPNQAVAFRQLAFAFQLNAAGCWLEGRCDNSPAGTLLVDLKTGRPCLLTSSRQPHPLWALLRAAAAAHGPQPPVPLTPATARLAGLLPVDPPPPTTHERF